MLKGQNQGNKVQMRNLHVKYQSLSPYSFNVDQKVKVNVARSKVMISKERSGQKKSACEITKFNSL